MNDAAYDLVGPVLPQALRLARYQALEKLPDDVDELESENDVINRTPSPEEARLLESNAKIMSALEGLFSWSEKDRTSRTSKLTRAESVRFQRTVYRIWLMSVIFGPRRFASRIGSADGEVDYKAQLIKSWNSQKTFLERFSSQDLEQISLLAGFLASTIAHWVESAERIDSNTRHKHFCDGLYLFAGPHVILRCYEDETSTYFPTEYLYDDGPHTEFLTRSLSGVIGERQLPLGGNYLGVVLDDVHGWHDTCDHCGKWADRNRRLPRYWNKTCWGDLKGRLNPQLLMAGNLALNLGEKSLVQALKGDWSRLLHEMFSRHRRGKYARWSTEDWTCADCWIAFFEDTLWRLVLDRKRTAKETVHTDCRYGHSCKKQCYEGGLAHAQRFNHLCEPTEESSGESDEPQMEDDDTITVKVTNLAGEEIYVKVTRSTRMCEVRDEIVRTAGWERIQLSDGDGTGISASLTAAELDMKNYDTIYALLEGTSFSFTLIERPNSDSLLEDNQCYLNESGGV